MGLAQNEWQARCGGGFEHRDFESGHTRASTRPGAIHQVSPDGPAAGGAGSDLVVGTPPGTRTQNLRIKSPTL